MDSTIGTLGGVGVILAILLLVTWIVLPLKVWQAAGYLCQIRNEAKNQTKILAAMNQQLAKLVVAAKFAPAPDQVPASVAAMAQGPSDSLWAR